jgi:hypothetical protein
LVVSGRRHLFASQTDGTELILDGSNLVMRVARTGEVIWRSVATCDGSAARVVAGEPGALVYDHTQVTFYARTSSRRLWTRQLWRDFHAVKLDALGVCASLTNEAGTGVVALALDGTTMWQRIDRNPHTLLFGLSPSGAILWRHTLGPSAGGPENRTLLVSRSAGLELATLHETTDSTDVTACAVVADGVYINDRQGGLRACALDGSVRFLFRDEYLRPRKVLYVAPFDGGVVLTTPYGML